MKVNWVNEKERLEELIKQKNTYEEIGRKYGVTGAAIKKAAKRLGITIEYRREINPNEHFNRGKGKINYCLNCGKTIKSNRKFCDAKCQQEHIFKEYVKSWKDGKINGLSGEYNLSKRIRRFLLEKNNYRCEKCGWGEKNIYTNTIPLEIHHIDGDYTNNKEENLQVLCPNCHSLTETYKSHNKNGRKWRKKYN